MPRGHKSKLRAQEKRRQARGETQGLKEDQATGAPQNDVSSCSRPVSGDAATSSSTASLCQTSGAPHTAAAAVGVSHKRSGKGSKGQGKGRVTSSNVPSAPENSRRMLLKSKSEVVLQYLMYKYKVKEPILKREMLNIVHKRFREDFPEILQMAANRVQVVFGLELKELTPGGSSYNLVSILDLDSDERLENGFPKSGIIMCLLGVIFLNNHCASEEVIWKFLSTLGIYEDKPHFIFGNARKFITKDLVQERYLEYQQKPDSDPPQYQFRWGSRAFAEASKAKIMEVLAKVTCCIVSENPSEYEGILADSREKASGALTAEAGIAAQISPSPKENAKRTAPH
ncbi:melanoma-associated antigen B2-like [Ctenodactylus gundi]